MADDGIDPGPRSAPRGVERSGLPPDLDEAVMDGLSRQRIALQDAAGDTDHAGGLAGIEALKRRAISLCTSAQGRVAVKFGFFARSRRHLLLLLGKVHASPPVGCTCAAPARNFFRVLLHPASSLPCSPDTGGAAGRLSGRDP